MPQSSSHPVRPEFSRLLQVDRQSPPQHSFNIEATAEERAALAKRFGLVALGSLKASGSLETLDNGRRAFLKARLTAEVTQSCVVTLEPVKSQIDESFSLEFDADADPTALTEPEIPDDLEVFLAQPDPPDPLVDGVVDVGECVAEHLALALPAYPRAPEVDFSEPMVLEIPEESPFKALAGLIKKD